MAQETAYIFDPRFLQHETEDYKLMMPNGEMLEPEPHPSNVRVTRRTAQLIAGSGITEALTSIPARRATPEEIGYVHAPEYIEQVRTTAGSGGGWLDSETPISPGSWDAAMLAVGSAMELVDHVIAGEMRNGYGLLRPPGHHAMAAQGMGFCVFNNVAVAARHAQRQHRVGRIAILDWDVHHGNGTQSAFQDDPNVLFVSIHQDDWYPAGWGAVADAGGPLAQGSTVNIPLPPGSGNKAYMLALEQIVGPVIRQFGPELIFVSAGQDPSMMDPLGHMMVTMDGFRQMASYMAGLADEICNGRLVGLQEGGYSAMYVPFCTLAVLEGLSGQRTAIDDPYRGDSELAAAEREFRPQQQEAIDAVRAVQSEWWGV